MFRIVCTLLLATTCVGASADDEAAPDFSRVVEATAMYQVHAGSLVSVAELAAGTRVRHDTVAARTQGQPGKTYVSVTAGGVTLQGWVETAALEAVGSRIDQLLEPLPEEEKRELPELFEDQSSAIQRAWMDVRDAIRENRELADPLPDPYFARAELWLQVMNHEAALRDYLRGAALAVRGGQNLRQYAEDFARLHEALRRYEAAPRRIPPGRAERHWARGVHAYNDEEYTDALRHFASAVQLAPHRPVFWYWRALVYKQMGHDERALHAVLIAADLEWKRDPHGRYRIRIDERLEHVQGPIRLWLEQFRLGDPLQRPVKSAISR